MDNVIEVFSEFEQDVRKDIIQWHFSFLPQPVSKTMIDIMQPHWKEVVQLYWDEKLK